MINAVPVLLDSMISLLMAAEVHCWALRINCDG